MRLALGFSTVLLTVCATVAVPLVAAGETRMPTIPDNNQAQEHTRITVTTESGEPVAGPVHRGDVLLVHGSGFDPQANKGGFPIPVPPGTPNGVFVVYSAFPEWWKPSENAPESHRKHPP